MNEISKEQKDEWIVQALELAGFEEDTEYPGLYSQVEGNIKSVVDLTAGVSTYLYDRAKKCKLENDDEFGTLTKLNQLISDTEDGKMPTVSEPDMFVDTGKQKNGVDFNVDPNTWPEGWDPSMGDKPPIDGVEVTPTNPIEHAPAKIVRSTAPPAPFVPRGTMIKNLVPRLKEIGKIKIGRKGTAKTSKKGTEYRPPEKFDHFEVVTLYKDDAGDFIPDAAIMGLIGDDAKELDISLLYNDPSLNFFTRYNQYKGGKCMCSGDGEQAIQADGTKLVCNPDTCTVFATKKCKANGILSVILKDAPRLGGVYKFRTTSFNSIKSIMSSMFFIQSLTGGILANIPLKMTVSPMSVNPVGSTMAQTIYVVNLEYPGTVDDLHKQTIELMTQRASMQSQIVELEARARIALSEPETKEEIQDVEVEFYPEKSKE